MLNVLTPEEVFDLIGKKFPPLGRTERVSLADACGRVLAEDIAADEYVPDFNRSTVDGYALRASDTFGCSEAIPAVLKLRGEVLMGQAAGIAVGEGECCYVPTGGEIPEGADCAVMLEYSENFGDGTIGISKAGAPGLNMIFRGDDVYPGKVFLESGRLVTPQDIGALASAGRTSVPVSAKLRVGVISTGDELVPADVKPGPGQVRDVNSPMIEAMLRSFGAEPVMYGIVKDDRDTLFNTVKKAVGDCDAVILSGGSSVGVKDAACEIIS